MTKSVLGLNLSAVAVLIFILSYFAGIEVLVLLLAYALLIEKDRWLNKQVFQAVYLKLAYLIVITVVGWVFDFLQWLFRNAAAIYSVENFIHFLISLALILIILLAISRVIHSQDADLPFVGHFADFTLDETVKAAEKTTPAAPATPFVPAAPAAEPDIAEACEDDTVSAEFVDTEPYKFSEEETVVSTAPPIDPDHWFCVECGRENFGKFCMGCGKPRPV
ncbi:MAG TPA: hypothetical protein DCM45_01385 [Clostridiales bacterium]|nr:hypothetical protein [Clostridiales bacterium]